jgi:hypothetical protein
VDSKYRSSWGGWCSSELLGHMAWVYGRIGGVKGNSSRTRFKVRDGSKVRFWHDLWCRDIVLKDVFPVLFGLLAQRML